MSLADVKASLKIKSIELMWVDDDDSKAREVLGEYSQEAGPGAIDRHGQPEYREHEFRYWNPKNYDPANPDNALQDYYRHESLCRGEWCYQGCLARAVVGYDTINGVSRLEFFSSGGCGGIESDSSPMILMAAEVGELKDLKAHLTVFGIPWTLTEENILQVAIAKLQEITREDLAGESSGQGVNMDPGQV